MVIIIFNYGIIKFEFYTDKHKFGLIKFQNCNLPNNREMYLYYETLSFLK